MKKVDSGEFYNAKQDNIFSEYRAFRAEEYYTSEFEKPPKEIQSYNESYGNEGVKPTQSEETDSAKTKEIQKQYDKLNNTDASDIAESSAPSSSVNASRAAANTSQAAVKTVSGGAATAAGGASVAATAVAAVVIVSAAVTGGFITDFKSYIENVAGMDYVSISVDLDEIISQADKSYGLGADNFSIELTEGATLHKTTLVEGKHSYLFTGLQPDQTYTYNLICNNPSLGSNSNCYSQSFTTLSVGEPKGVYDELNNYIVYDEITRTASVYYSVYLSDYENVCADSALYVCSSEQNDISDLNHVVYSDDEPNEYNFFQGEISGITCNELFFYLVGEKTTEYGLETVELFSFRLNVDLPEEWQTANDPLFDVDESEEVSACQPDKIQVSGKLNNLNEAFTYCAYVVQYGGEDGTALTERMEVDLTVDPEKMTYSFECGAYYGVDQYKYVVYAMDDDNEVTVYESKGKPFTASRNYDATYTRVEPSYAAIEYGAGGITITADTGFVSAYNNYFYKLVVTNSAGEVYGEYTGTDKAVIEIGDYAGLDEIIFTYYDIGEFENGEKIFASHATEGVAFCVPAINFSAEYSLNRQYFTLSYACDMVYGYADASLEIEVSDGANVYTKRVDGVSESGTIILDNIEGEPGNVTVTGTLFFKDYQADGATHAIRINPTAYALNYRFEVTSVKADISGYSTEMPVTLCFDYLLPEDYRITVTDEAISLNLSTELTNRFSFSDLQKDTEANLTIRVTNSEGNAWGVPETVNISKSAAEAEYVSPTMTCTNPGDALVTYNEDGTINIYREMIPSAYGRDTISDDERVYYNAFVQGYTYDAYSGDELVLVYTDGYDVVGREKYAVIENIPNQNYILIYYVMFDYNGVSYVMYTETPSGSVENVYDNVSAMVTYGDGNTTITVNVAEFGLLCNSIIVNGVEYEYTTYTDESETSPTLVLEGEIEVSEVTILFTMQGYHYDDYISNGEITIKGNKYALRVITIKT